MPGSPLVAERTVELLRDAAGAGVVELDDRARRCRTSTWPGPPSASTRWRPACGSSTGTASRSRRPGERGPLLVAQCDRQSVLSEIKLAVDAGPGGHRAAAAGPARRVDHRGGLGRPRPRPSTPTTSPRSGSRRWPSRSGPSWCASTSSCARCARRARGTVEQTHASLTRHLLEETYEVLEAIDHLDADDRRRASATSRRSSATCSSRSCSTPSSAPRRASSPWPTWPAASTTSSCARHPHVFGPVAGAASAPTACSALGGAEGRREGPDVDHGRHPGRPAEPRLRREGAEEGGGGRLRLGRRGRRPARRWPRSWAS